MKAIHLVQKVYNSMHTHNYGILNRGYILEVEEWKSMFDFKRPMIMDDLSYLVPKNEGFFKKAITPDRVDEEKKVVYFTVDDVEYSNHLVCFRSNVFQIQ